VIVQVKWEGIWKIVVFSTNVSPCFENDKRYYTAIITMREE